MKILKRNQLIILVVALMLITAGYLNFTSNYKKEAPVTSNLNLANSVENDGLGDATLVNGDSLDESQAELPNDNEERKTDSTLVSNDEKTDYYFENSRLDREKMYSQMLEAYQNMYTGDNISIEQKNMAATEIGKINATRNAIMICENLIKTKGIKDIVIFINDTQISAVVDAKELTPEQIAQIQNIISREMKAEIVNIHISCK